MPLMHGKSKKAFGHNVEVEMEHGHPLKQSLAIAYSVKRKAAKKHAKGGAVEPKETFMEHEAKESKAKEYAEHHGKKHHYAKGGMLTHKGYQPSEVPHYDADFADMDHDVEEMASGYVGHPGAHAKHDAAAEHEDMKKLNQHGKHEIGPEGRHYAKGGYAHPRLHPEAQKKIEERNLKGRVNEVSGSPEKGINKPYRYESGHGESMVGANVRAGYKTAAKLMHKRTIKELENMPKPKLKGLAHGGEVHPHQSEEHELDMVGKIIKMRQHAYAKGGHVDHEKGVHKQHPSHHFFDKKGKRDFGVSYAGAQTRYGESPYSKFDTEPGYEIAKIHHKEKLKELKSMPKPKLKGLAHGGAVHHYSHGGKVANNTHPFEYEFHTPNEFDDLVNRDDLEFHYTGKNSGDYLSDAREDHDRKDMVAKIMKSRAKKDKSPYGY